MTTYTITGANTLRNLGTARAGGDIYNVNGGSLVIDQDTRYGLGGGAEFSLAAMTISATLGGLIEVDARAVRLVPYTGGSGTITAGSTITCGGATGIVIGKTAAALLAFVGDQLETTTGVYIDDIQSADSNRVVFKDQTGVNRTNPYEAAGTITFNSVLVGAGSSYRLMFTAPAGAGNDYGEAGAITVEDASGNPITGTISSGSIAFTFDYDGDTLGGTAGTDKAVTLIGVRPGYGKFAVATGLLTRSKAISLSLVAEQDRVYA